MLEHHMEASIKFLSSFVEDKGFSFLFYVYISNFFYIIIEENHNI